ncbi:thiolase family protein [Syntrophothermus lipocalidus]|uniref:Acetyl-CoA acetyltransferase n=1 Tax=Syntrophothermus lipocalidus (strain DSM 12680 / TGB-C1) TaxID=643648 RepID=D7CKM8_SYNLT|nr:thiolase family protein [Syntrophothermus lipocalidus]ADI01263.1 acetyl-CoA acetyltransferase [Syntrophothermus lipocalidus DSM 12680]
MRDVVIVSGKRTAIGNFLGALKDFSAVDLGTIALKAAINSAGISPDTVEEVAAGHVYQAGCKGNPARQITIGAGCPVETVSVTVNQQCPSAMRALEIISQEIMLGKIDAGAAVGIESMSNVPYLLLKARTGYRMGNGELVDGMLYDALIDAFGNGHQGITAENLAEMYNISREEQDEWAFISHQRACQAIKEGKFKDEIVPVEVKTKKETFLFDTDEHPNPDTTLESLAKLKPAFKKDGTVTAGNASSINDAACAAVVMAHDKAVELGIKPLARIVATASAAVEPRIMGIGVVPAVKRALKFAGMSLDDVQLWEINEAFAAQFLACNRELKLDTEKINVNGSGISLGHPVGCTGLRLVITLINEMKRRNLRYGCAALCAGGGPAMATIIEVL